MWYSRPRLSCPILHSRGRLCYTLFSDNRGREQMIKRTMLFGSAVIIALSTVLAPAPAAKAAEAKLPDKQAIAEVAAGKRTEAHASWWGFDPADATAALQAAINSGARKLIVENMGGPWIVDKLQLASNQEIVFAKGVVVQAKRGAFHGTGDSLFTAVLKKNITLTGPGATLKMWKQDYDDRKQYSHAEWRHVLNLHSCAHVQIAGLTLADSGGDGIYLGVAQQGVPCSDVVIRDVACVNNYRQGISVISARNLLIENCVLKDTWDTAPMAGIDFEPNRPSEELTNCVMRNCLSENNRGDGYVLYLRPLRAASKPISVRIENCRSVGCRCSAGFVTGNDSETAAVKGMMDFIHCKFEGSQQAGITVSDKPVDGASELRELSDHQPGRQPADQYGDRALQPLQCRGHHRRHSLSRLYDRGPAEPLADVVSRRFGRRGAQRHYGHADRAPRRAVDRVPTHPHADRPVDAAQRLPRATARHPATAFAREGIAAEAGEMTDRSRLFLQSWP